MTNFLHFSPLEYIYNKQYITFIRKNFQSCRLSTIILRVVLLHTKYIPESSSEDNEIQKKGNARCVLEDTTSGKVRAVFMFVLSRY